MGRLRIETLPQLLELLQKIYRNDMRNDADIERMRACIEFLLRLLHQ